MAGINRSTFLDPIIDEAVDAIAKAHKWSVSQTIAELLRESPSIIRELFERGIDPVTLEPKSDAPTG
jgi:hypothetical protein